jgi:cell division protein FtsQ
VQAAVAVVLLGLGVWLVWAGPVLAVSTIQVDGVTTLPAELVREAAGVEEGTPLLRVDVDAAEAGVAALPQVASVEVTRGWPRTVVITVVERVPVAVVGEPGNRSLIDADGVLFDSVSGDPPAGVVPLVVDSPGPGDPATMAALTAIRAFPAALREQVAGVAAPDPDAISMALVDGTVVRWGDAGKSPAKASALTALIGQIAAGTLEPASTIDVSAPEAVVLR